jgi:hypothetical protein
MLGRLLRHSETEDVHLARAVEFWDGALVVGVPDGLAGFGWLAEVDLLDDELWASRTQATLGQTAGSIDWSHKVAERAASLPPSTTTLSILNSLVRGAVDEWDRRGNFEQAVGLLRSAAHLAATAEYERLRTSLLERGFSP